MNGPLQTVHVRVNDAATGQPTPARVRFADAEGNYLAPFGRLTSFATGKNQDVGGNLLLGRKAFAYIDGTCEIALPPGPIHVEIHKGPEYVPLEQDVTLAAGKLALRLPLQRWLDLRKEGWYSGDCRAHFLSPFAALLEGQAEDLAVVNLLAREYQVAAADGKTYPAISNLLAFTGQEPALAKPGCLVAVNTFNTHPVLGSLGLLHCHRLVFPLSFGGPDGKDDWSLADWCDQCHRKNGLVVWTMPWHEAEDFAFGEPLADLILGKVDAFEMDFFQDSPFDVLSDWYDLWNAGIPVPLAGSSGKESNACPLAGMRTFARLLPGDDLTCKNWIEAVRAGRSFITNSPLLSFQVNGRGPGEAVDLESGADKVQVSVQARSMVPFDLLELIQNGEAIAQATATGSPCSAALEVEVAVSETQWLAARCRGALQLLQAPSNQRVLAHTSPIQVRVASRPFQPRAASLQRLQKELGRMRQWAREKARCDSDRQRAKLAGIFDQAMDILSCHKHG